MIFIIQEQKVKGLIIRFLINQNIIESFGELKSYLQKNGKIIEDFDIVIGATALTKNHISKESQV